MAIPFLGYGIIPYLRASFHRNKVLTIYGESKRGVSPSFSKTFPLSKSGEGD
jgi:hypothetical protein